MKRLTMSLVLIITGVILSLAARMACRGDAPIFYWGILPGLPFVILGLFALLPRISLKPVLGAAIGALLVTVLSYGSLFLSAHLHPGDVNMGLAMILMGLPLYYAFGMIVGWIIGEKKA